MRVTIISIGTRGDVQPFIALGTALHNAGYQVRAATSENHGRLVAQHGLQFFPIHGDIQQIIESDAGKALATSKNPAVYVRALYDMIAPVVWQILQDAWAACQETDVIVSNWTFNLLTHSIAERLRLPLVTMAPYPVVPTNQFPLTTFAPPFSLGGWYNRLSYRMWDRVDRTLFGSQLNRFRRETLGLPAQDWTAYYNATRRLPTLISFSRHIVDRPPDWLPNVHITGYYFLDEPGWQPPSALLDFLADGEPPVYIGFGSMSSRNPEQTAELALRALRRTGQRGLLLTGWQGIQAGDLPDTVFKLDSAPHLWLFPRMKAVVHHGGAGTTAAGLRAGIPAVIVPHITDQFFWGTRLAERGLAPSPIPRRALTADSLAYAIRLAATHAPIRERARQMGEYIRAEDGLKHAADLFSKWNPLHESAQPAAGI